jgi:hypothetical protein
MKFKDGVTLIGVKRQILGIIPIVEAEFDAVGEGLTITCTTTGHPPNDPHTHGYAIDCRTHGLTPETQDVLAATIQKALGPDYYVQHEPQVLDDKGNVVKGEHLHIQLAKQVWHKLVGLLL